MTRLLWMGPGRRNVASVAVCLACVSGFGFYSLTIFAGPLAREFSLTAVSAGTALFLLTAGVAGTLVSSLLTRYDVRAIMLSGSLLMALGLLLLGHARSEPSLYLGYVVLGLGQASLGVVPGLSLITSWFQPPRRRTALTMAITGWSVGGVLVAPLVTLGLQHASLGAVSTSASAALLGTCLACTALITPFRGQRTGVEHAQPGILRPQVVRTHAFWQLTVAQLFVAMAQVGSLAHLFTAVEARENSTFAGRAVSTVAAGSLLGRWLGNTLLRRLDSGLFYRVLMVIQAVALSLIAVGRDPRALLVTAALLGFTIGNNMLLHPLRLSELFGPRDYARILALSTLVVTAGTAAGPLLLGRLRDIGGNWTLPYLVAGGISLSAAAIATVPVRGRQPAHTAPCIALPGAALSSLPTADS